ncbi:hypothetical protein niasHS_003111 [Heterodera schachtii]|uniref:Integrase catalytic domain-containing protein n=1 Tax=Heterodera schachtii TaxID=97005 RepID=A0ABD2K9W2_HETSC
MLFRNTRRYSKWPPNRQRQQSKNRHLFSRHGIPEILVSDNGTQFTSNEFDKFMAVNGVNHLFSAPYNPMSNGQAEGFVGTFKRTIFQNWQQGKISKRTGVIYDVAFADGRSGRYHANQLRPRNMSDSDDQLSVMFGVFDITKPIAVEEQREIPLEMQLEEQHDEQENFEGQNELGQQQRDPQRDRRPPQRFSP